MIAGANRALENGLQPPAAECASELAARHLPVNGRAPPLQRYGPSRGFSRASRARRRLSLFSSLLEPLAESQPDSPVPERFRSGAGRRGGAGGVRNRADERQLVVRAPSAGDRQPEVPCRLVGGGTKHLL